MIITHFSFCNPLKVKKPTLLHPCLGGLKAGCGLACNRFGTGAASGPLAIDSRHKYLLPVVDGCEFLVGWMLDEKPRMEETAMAKLASTIRERRWSVTCPP